MEYKAFKLEIRDYIAHLAFNRADKANSLNEASWEEMRNILEELDENNKVRAIILSGEGRHFCAGMDLETLMSQSGMSETCEAKKREQLKKFIFKNTLKEVKP